MKKDASVFETKLRKTGSAAGVTIPAEFLRHLGYDIGDQLRVTLADQGLQIQKVDPDFDAFMKLYDQVEDRFDPLFKRLEG